MAGNRKLKLGPNPTNIEALFGNKAALRAPKNNLLFLWEAAKSDDLAQLARDFLTDVVEGRRESQIQFRKHPSAATATAG